MFLKTVLKEMSCSESSSMKKCNSTHTHTVLFLYRHNVIRMSLSIQILFASKLFVSTLLYSFCILVHNSTGNNNSTCSFFLKSLFIFWPLAFANVISNGFSSLLILGLSVTFMVRYLPFLVFRASKWRYCIACILLSFLWSHELSFSRSVPLSVRSIIVKHFLSLWTVWRASALLTNFHLPCCHVFVTLHCFFAHFCHSSTHHADISFYISLHFF